MPASIYLDNNATTAALPEVVAVINDVLRQPDNAASPHHVGRQCRQRLEAARATLEDLLAADPGTLIFTSGATEANNLVLKGVLLPKLLQGATPKLVTTCVEHSSVLKTAGFLESLGVELTWLGVDSKGQVRADPLVADRLGVGRNMAKAIWHWLRVTGLIEKAKAHHRLCRSRYR